MVTKPKMVDASQATKPASELTELLTTEWLEGKGFSRLAARLRVVKFQDGSWALWPADHKQAGDRLPELLGIEKKPEGQWTSYPTTGFCPPAVRLDKLGEGWEGAFVVKLARSGRIFIAMPHSTMVAEFEQKGVFDFTAQPVPAGSVFEPVAQGRYICRPKKGATMIAIKDWDMEFQADGKTIAYDNLVRRPALTALVWIAGPTEMVSKMNLSGLLLYDDEQAKANAGPKYLRAQQFAVLDGWHTAFELFGYPFGNANLTGGSMVDLTDFRQNVKTITEKGKRWINRVLQALLHEDRFANADAGLRMLMDEAYYGDGDPMRRDTLIAEAGQHTPPEYLRQICDETVREADAALDWFKDWAEWAEIEVRQRNASGQKFGLPRPHSRPASDIILADMDVKQVATQVLAMLREEIATRQRPPEPVTKPTTLALTPAQIATAIRTAHARKTGKAAVSPTPARATTTTPAGPLSPKSPLRRKAEKPTPADGAAHVAAETGEQLARVSGFAGEITVGDLILPEMAAQLQAIAKTKTDSHTQPHPEQNPDAHNEVKCQECQRFVLVPQGWFSDVTACTQHSKTKGKARPHLLVEKPAPEPIPEPVVTELVEPITPPANTKTPKKPLQPRKKAAVAV